MHWQVFDRARASCNGDVVSCAALLQVFTKLDGLVRRVKARTGIDVLQLLEDGVAKGTYVVLCSERSCICRVYVCVWWYPRAASDSNGILCVAFGGGVSQAPHTRLQHGARL